MKACRRNNIFAILVTILLVFAMMPMAAETVFADEDEVTVSVGVYDKTNSVSGQGGTYTFCNEDMTHTIGRHTAPAESEVVLSAAPANGYRFEGWTYGRVTGDGDEMTIKPEEGDLLYTESVIRFPAGQGAGTYGLCAVFREVSDTPPEIDISTLQVLPPEERQSDRLVTEGDKINVSVKITDNGTIKKAIAWFLHEHKPDAEDPEDYIRAKMVSFSKQENDIWTGVFEVNDKTDLGLWNFGYVEVEDNDNNKVGHYNCAGYYGEDYSPYSDLSRFDFTVKDNHKVTFETRGGSDVPEQTVISGKKATRPADPTKGGGAWRGGGDFVGWYADEELKQEFNFNDPITADTKLYAKWAYGLSVCSYDKTNSADYDGGKYRVLLNGETDGSLYFGGCNFTLYEGDAITLKAQPDKGYLFTGWYKGEYIGVVDYYHTQVSRPLDMSDPDNLLSSEPEYSFTIGQSTVICPVFEVCTDHDFGEQMIRKATPDEDGCIYRACSKCGAEDIIAPLLKAGNISLEGTSFDYTGKAIEPKVTVANADEELAADCYTVEYANNVNAGIATATVTLKGDYYEGSKVLEFRIIDPSSPSDQDSASGKSAASAAAASAVKAGGEYSYGGQQYVVTALPAGSAPGEVAFKAAKNVKKVTVPAAVKLADGKTYNVTSVNAKAFKGKKIRTVTIGKNVKKIKKNAFKKSKATKMIVKSKLLKKATVRGALKGSKIKTIQVKVGKKSLNKKYLKKYKKIFTKKNAGKKATIK